MFENRYVFWGVILIAVLFVANIISYFCSGWGLITVRVHEVPLGTIIRSIERQGSVTIYTNIDPMTPVSMDVVKVPLPEAMESLAQNIPPPDAPQPGGAPRRGGFGGAQWKLAFFAAPSSAQVKQEIRTFQGGGASDGDNKIFSYRTDLQMLATDSGTPVADPRLQMWSGLKPPPPAPAQPAAATDGSTNADNSPPQPPPLPTTAIDYLDAIAQSADVWVMAPATWDAKVSAPDSGSSIGKAVKKVVRAAHGSLEQAFVLYTRGGGPRGPGGGGGRGFGADTGWATWEDRMRNAINGLPAESRPEALNQLSQEVTFQQQVRAAPPEQRRGMMRSHFMDRMATMDTWRRSPERRAQMYARVVSNRQAARGVSK